MWRVGKGGLERRPHAGGNVIVNMYPSGANNDLIIGLETVTASERSKNHPTLRREPSNYRARLTSVFFVTVVKDQHWTIFQRVAVSSPVVK
jgi:hypothetical protein